MDSSMEGKSSSKRRGVDKDLVFCCLFLVFPILQFCIFYIVVNINSFTLAFKKYDVMENVYRFTKWDNFVRVWQELTQTSLLLKALVNSLLVWIFSVVVGTIFAVIFSYYIYKKRLMGKTYRFVLFLPTVLPAILLVIMFKFFMNEAVPIIWTTATGEKLGPILSIPNVRFVMIVFYTVWIGFGSQVLLYTGSMEQISPSVIEAGKLDGASPIVELWKLVLPEVLPTIETFLIAGIATIFTNQANLYSFYGVEVQPDDYTIGYYLFYLVNNSDFGVQEYPYASALGLCCTALALPLTYGVKKLIGKLEDK